ncbi:hypothetical protein AGMMS50293_15940 [Spirochaetia bacterium]|nr:hypothetical protein AGMMS50293_15940 [Spirochaetia bacterium]
MALVPFWGDDNDIIISFGAELALAVGKMDGYTSAPVDMTNLPDDVPEGGFPPYICPSPSLTKDIPYAMTGELVKVDDSYSLRLYLWSMADTRLLCSDEIGAANREELAQYLPGLLEWLFSWIKKDADPKAAATGSGAGSGGGGGAFTEDKFLYLGLRFGTSFHLYTLSAAAQYIDANVDRWFNLNFAFQISYDPLSFLGFQTGALFNYDHAPFQSWSMQLPVLVKWTMFREKPYGALLAGLYYNQPLSPMYNEDLGGSFNYTQTLPLGYTLGLNLGIRETRGYFFLDIRWSQDIGETVRDNGDILFKRAMMNVSIGYEMGFFDKKKK